MFLSLCLTSLSLSIYIYIYIYIYVCVCVCVWKSTRFGKSDNMRKISGKWIDRNWQQIQKWYFVFPGNESLSNLITPAATTLIYISMSPFIFLLSLFHVTFPSFFFFFLIMYFLFCWTWVKNMSFWLNRFEISIKYNFWIRYLCFAYSFSH